MIERRTISCMTQGAVNGRKSIRARHMDALECERRHGQIIAALALAVGAILGCMVTLIVQGIL